MEKIFSECMMNIQVFRWKGLAECKAGKFKGKQVKLLMKNNLSDKQVTYKGP